MEETYMAEKEGTGGGGVGGGTTKSGIETPRTPTKPDEFVTKIYPGSHSLGQGARGKAGIEGPRDGKRGPGGD
jgi:hypothetical protein